MHPIVIISSAKDPAIGEAVDCLQNAGFEVRVLNSATAKLVDFLGALAGADEDEDADKKSDAKEPDDDAKEPDVEPSGEAPADKNDPLDPKKMEALIAGEPVIVELVDGHSITLHPNNIIVAAQTQYSLNESKFSFWPSAVSNELIEGGVELVLNDQVTGHLTRVIFSEEAMSPPVLRIGRDWLAVNFKE